MIKQSLLRAGINTFAAFHTRHPCFALGDGFLTDGKGRAGLNALFTSHALIGIDANMKNIDLVREGLESAKGTKQAALGTPFRQYGQNNHQANK